MKLIAKDVYCFDAEWVPCIRAGRLLTNLLEPAPSGDVCQALWKRAGATPEKPHPFLKLALSRIVSLSAIHRHVNEDGTVTLDLQSFPSTANPDIPEADIITPFLELVAGQRAQMVGFNSGSSDLPILVQRGIANGCVCPAFGRRPNKPWEGLDYFARFSEAHLDLAHVLTGGGFGSAVMPSMDEIAAASSIPGKLDHSGGGVLDLWQTGRYAELTGYNETDACTTYLLWLRIASFLGRVSVEERDAEIAVFNRLLRRLSSTRPHLVRFLEVWRARRQLAPIAGKMALGAEDAKVITRIVAATAAGGAATCEVRVVMADLEPDFAAKLQRHLVKSPDGRHHLSRLGRDYEGNVVPGFDPAGRPLLLRIETPDLAGIRDAVTRARIPGVDEWASPDAA
jgi:3'-5' exonuclease